MDAMSTGGDTGAGRRLAAAVRALRRDLWTVAADPMPPMAWPRWLARLPHLLVMVYAAVVFWAYEGQTQISALLTGVQAAAVVLALFRPVPAWWVVTLAMIPGSAVAGDPYPWSHGTIATLAGVMFLLALRARPRTVFAALAVSVLVGLACTGFDVGTNNPNAMWAVAFFYTDVGQAASIWGLAALLGGLRRARRVSRSQLAAQSQISAEERARRTLLEERTRIARELHDVVTHNVSVMVIQAGAARKVMDAAPEQAKEALLAVEAGGRAAMAELRHVMGLISPATDAPDLAPQPGLDGLDTLINRVRGAGVPVDLTVTGRSRPVPAGVGLTAYRVVQEALTNTVKHAAGATATVTLGYEEEHLRVEVRDNGGRPNGATVTGNGRGLVGLRERLAIYGGTLEAGPRPTGGYRVRAVLPLEPIEESACA